MRQRVAIRREDISPARSSEHVAVFEDHTVIGNEQSPVAVENHADGNVAKAFKDGKAAIQQDHGVLLPAGIASIPAPSGSSRSSSAAARLSTWRRRVSRPRTRPKTRRVTATNTWGSDYIGWLHFHTIWNVLSVDQPGMLE